MHFACVVVNKSYRSASRLVCFGDHWGLGFR